MIQVFILIYKYNGNDFFFMVLHMLSPDLHTVEG